MRRSRPATSTSRTRLTLFAAGLGLVVLAGADARAAPPSPATVSAAPSTSPPPPSQPPVPAPRGASEAKPRMWAVTLSSMEVYENGSGYLYGFWRQFGETLEKPARLYWGRGCPDISDRVYHVLQAGFAQQHQFYLIVDRVPDPRQPGAYCVRGVELEARHSPGPPSAPAPQKPHAQGPPLIK